MALGLRDAATDKEVNWRDADVGWSMLRTNGTQENSDAAPRAPGAGIGTIQTKLRGAAVAGVDFKPREVRLDAASLRKFAAERANAELPESVKTGPLVRVVQSCKTIVRFGDCPPAQDGNVSGKTGQQVEIRPIVDPSGVGIGSDVPLVAYVQGDRQGNARVIATHLATGETQECITNSSGIATFRLDRAGPWRVEFHHLVKVPNPAPDTPEWTLWSASLTFEAGPSKAEAGGAR